MIPDVGYESAGSVIDKAIPGFGTLKLDDAIINGRTRRRPTRRHAARPA